MIHFSRLAEGIFARSWPRGTQGARVYARLKFGPRTGSLAQALEAQVALRSLYARGCIPSNQGQPGTYKNPHIYKNVVLPACLAKLVLVLECCSSRVLLVLLLKCC